MTGRAIRSRLSSPGGTGGPGRLVNRFATAGRLHVHLRLGGHGPAHSRPISAEISDISITGMLARIPEGLRVRIGAMVTLGEGGSTATCRVVHADSPAETASQALGLEIEDMTDSFRDELHDVVAALRKDRGQILYAWEHSE